MVKINLWFTFLFLLSTTCFSQVGIETDTPETTLDINGNLKIRTTPTAPITSTVAPLFIDNTTKEVKVVKSSSGNTFLINYLTYRLNNVDKVQMINFNTNIKTSDYVLIIVGDTFFSTQLNSSRGGRYHFSPIHVATFEEGGTWRIKADYHGGVTYDNSNGDWTVSCLAIGKAIIKSLDTVHVDMGASSSGAAATVPDGL